MLFDTIFANKYNNCYVIYVQWIELFPSTILSQKVPYHKSSYMEIFYIEQNSLYNFQLIKGIVSRDGVSTEAFGV
jgi:hypothetical protein